MRSVYLYCAILALAACSADYDRYATKRDNIVVTNKVQPAAEKVETIKAQDILTQAEQGVDEPMETATMASSQPQPIKQPEAKVETALTSQSNNADIPPNARPGECYAKVLIPAVTETKTEKVQVAEEQKVLARIIPAQYRVETERVLIREARQYWKKGQGAVEKIDSTTGEILCLVEEPAQYKTVEKRVLIEPEKPEYKMMPAQYETVSKTFVVTPEKWEWQRILCETNVTPTTISMIQRALQAKGYKPGKIDGVYGTQTRQAINAYQVRNGLATRGLTHETLNHMGVRLATEMGA